jgi:hypothetical protein
MFKCNSSWVFQIKDSKTKNSNLIVKISGQCEEMGNEVKILFDLRKI